MAPGVLGVVDGTQVAILAPTEHEERFFNRKGYHSLNVMIICDSDGLIICVDASTPGSAHHSHVWQSHPLSRHMAEGARRGDFVFLLARTLHYHPVMAGKNVNGYCCMLHNIATRAGVPTPMLTPEEAEIEQNQQIQVGNEIVAEAGDLWTPEDRRRNLRVNPDHLEGRAFQQAL